MDARNGCAARCRFCAFGGEGGDCCGRGVMGEGHSLPDDPQQSCLDPIRVCRSSSDNPRLSGDLLAVGYCMTRSS